MNPDRLVNIPRAAELANVSRRTLYHWIANGFVPSDVRDKSRLVRLSDVLAHAERRGLVPRNAVLIGGHDV